MKMAEKNKIGELQARRRWNCPDEATIGAYIDGALDEQASGRLGNHLSDCTHCRELVAATVKLQRVENLPEVPANLMRKAREAGQAELRVWWQNGWRWAPASSAAAALVCAGLIISVWRAPQDVALPKRAAPAGPAITKFEETRPDRAMPSEQERNPKHSEAAPTMIAPQEGQVVARKDLRFSWNAVPEAISYEVRVVTLEGDLVWEESCRGTEVRVPDRLALSSGKYFVMVSATMGSGRMRKASPVEFEVANAQ